jgi:hypothetical protein
LSTVNIQNFGAAQLLLSFILFFIFGCGFKGPPVPPRWEPPPKVNDLSYNIEGSNLKLSWSLPASASKRTSPIDGFRVYRSQISISEPHCEKCPLTFSAVGNVSNAVKQGANAKAQAITFDQILEGGYRYVYMVRAYSDNGMVSKDSNTVKFSLQ